MSNHNNGIVNSSELIDLGNNRFLFEQQWASPDRPVKGAVFIVHGLAEYSGRYQRFAEALVNAGYPVYSGDMRGHGNSSGKPTRIHRFSDFLDDLEVLLAKFSEMHPDKPHFLFGHSLGGAIATLYTIERQPDIAGLLLSAPALKVSDETPALLVKLAGVVSAILPGLPTAPLDFSAISRDDETVERYKKDPLIYTGGVVARTGAETIKAMRKISRGSSQLTLPLLVMHGSADRITNPEGSRELHQNSASDDKTLKIYDGFYHELLNEPPADRQQVTADIIAWLDARC